MPNKSSLTDSKLIKLLRSLSYMEMKQFHKFVHSPYHNGNSKCTLLIDTLFQKDSRLESEELNQIDLKKLLGESEKAINTVFRDAIRLFEKYLVQLQLEKKNFDGKILLLDELSRRNLDAQFELVWNHSRKKLFDEKKLSSDFYNMNFEFEYSKLKHITKKQPTKKEKSEQLIKTINALDKKMLTQRLLLANINQEDTNWNNVSKELDKKYLEDFKQNDKCFKTFLKLSSLIYYKKDPLVQIQHLIYNLSSEKNEICYTNLKKFHDENHIHFSLNDNNEIHIFLINYCINSIISGDIKYYKNLFDVYITCIERGTFLNRGILTEVRLKNLIIAAIKVSNLKTSGEIKMDNVEKQFLYSPNTTLEKYINKIHPDSKKGTYHYLKGYILYQEKNYEEAINEFNDCIDTKPSNKNFFGLDAHAILYKIYYDLKEDWALETIKSVIRTVNYNKFNKDKKTVRAYVNFFNMLNILYKKRIDPNSHKIKKSRLLDKLNQYPYITDKIWLKQRIEKS